MARQAPWSTDAKVVLDTLFPAGSELKAFILDHLHERFPGFVLGMDRTPLYELLFEAIDPRALVEKLEKLPVNQPAEAARRILETLSYIRDQDVSAEGVLRTLAEVSPDSGRALVDAMAAASAINRRSAPIPAESFAVLATWVRSRHDEANRAPAPGAPLRMVTLAGSPALLLAWRAVDRLVRAYPWRVSPAALCETLLYLVELIQPLDWRLPTQRFSWLDQAIDVLLDALTRQHGDPEREVLLQALEYLERQGDRSEETDRASVGRGSDPYVTLAVLSGRACLLAARGQHSEAQEHLREVHRRLCSDEIKKDKRWLILVLRLMLLIAAPDELGRLADLARLISSAALEAATNIRLAQQRASQGHVDVGVHQLKRISEQAWERGDLRDAVRTEFLSVEIRLYGRQPVSEAELGRFVNEFGDKGAAHDPYYLARSMLAGAWSRLHQHGKPAPMPSERLASLHAIRGDLEDARGKFHAMGYREDEVRATWVLAQSHEVEGVLWSERCEHSLACKAFQETVRVLRDLLSQQSSGLLALNRAELQRELAQAERHAAQAAAQEAMQLFRSVQDWASLLVGISALVNAKVCNGETWWKRDAGDLWSFLPEKLNATEQREPIDVAIRLDAMDLVRDESVEGLMKLRSFVSERLLAQGH